MRTSLKCSVISRRVANLSFKNVENLNYETKLVLRLSNNVEFVSFIESACFAILSQNIDQ